MTENEVMTQLTDQLKTEYKITDELGADTSLDDLLDSLDIINLMFFVESDLGVKITDDLIDQGDILVMKNLSKYIAENQA